MISRLRTYLTSRRDERRVTRDVRAERARFVCPHDDYLCNKYGCPDDPYRTGDGCG